jgi:sterol desaturase/sphingolipid hydroxylase (fatty acid hydroxylase superfamily)
MAAWCVVRLVLLVFHPHGDSNPEHDLHRVSRSAAIPAAGAIATMGERLAGYGPISQLPLWVQGAIAIVIGDFIGYWTHRWHHTRQLWDYHAVHHSAEIVDWLTAVRLHPVNDIISRVMQASPLLILGISPIAVEFYVPFLSSYVALIHANISWTYGPFRYVLASPAFHRWHHTMDEEGWGKNFAGLFPIYDVIFGTFYMPRGRQPKNFGLYGETITENFMDQLIYPFRHWKILKKWLNRSQPVTEYQEEETVNL